MGRFSLFFFVLCHFVFIFLGQSQALAFDAPLYFEKKCSSCHSIGGGDDVGPDLKDISKRREKAWLAKFVRESQAVINSGDPVANELFNKFKRKVMPDQELSDDELNTLFAFIDSGGQGGAVAKKMRSALEANTYDIQKGEELFTGKVKFVNGGTACLSCHSAGSAGVLGGGTLGPDLTKAFASYGDNGLSKVITNIAFPSMQEMYKDKALTEQEVFSIKAFLFDTDRKGIVDRGHSKKFFFLGFIGFLLALGFLDLVFRDRRKKTRRPF